MSAWWARAAPRTTPPRAPSSRRPCGATTPPRAAQTLPPPPPFKVRRTRAVSPAAAPKRDVSSSSMRSSVWRAMDGPAFSSDPHSSKTPSVMNVSGLVGVSGHISP